MAEAKKPATKKKANLVVEAVTEGEAPEVVIEKEEVSKAPAKAEKKVTAKAGKRSAKATREAEQEQAKEERKASGEEQVKAPQKPARTREERAGKKYREAAKLVDKNKLYAAKEALDLAVKTSTVKFDATVELHINLEVDPKLADQNVRDMVTLPAGTGKTIRVATLADDTDAEKLFAKLDKEEIDFDVLVAAPNMMPKLGKYARMLGPRGLMPSPKSGTVSADVKAAADEAKTGRVEYRVDQSGIIHLGIGKVSFGGPKLLTNYEAILASVRANRPPSVKGPFIKAITVASSMGPGIKIEV